jgi:ribosomal 50S subunit-recycling heat shock protein
MRYKDIKEKQEYAVDSGAHFGTAARVRVLSYDGRRASSSKSYHVFTVEILELGYIAEQNQRREASDRVKVGDKMTVAAKRFVAPWAVYKAEQEEAAERRREMEAKKAERERTKAEAVVALKGLGLEENDDFVVTFLTINFNPDQLLKLLDHAGRGASPSTARRMEQLEDALRESAGSLRAMQRVHNPLEQVEQALRAGRSELQEKN